MKLKISVAALLVFVLSWKGQAQHGSLGISIGPSYSKPTIKNLPGVNTSTYTDGAASLTGLYQIDPKFGVVLDVGICNRGMVFTQPVSVGTYDPYSGTTSYRDEKDKYRYSFSYLDNSLMARYTLGGKFKVYANLGVYYSLLLKTKKLIVDEYYDSNGGLGITEVHGKYASNTNYSYNKSDMGIALGFGIQRGRFGLDYRYHLGVAQISKAPSTVSIFSSFSTVKLTFVFLNLKKEILPHTHAHKKRVR